jgi:NAD+ kinase
MVISVGGDGTLIRTAKKIYRNGIPIFGINLGSLGYLAEVEVAETDKMIERVFQNEYHIEERLMLEAKLVGESAGEQDSFTVLNDISIIRGDLPYSIKISSYIDDYPLEVFLGDGLIVATPTGSTAYSLSAGGPVVDPEVNAISIVPVCPHIVFSRPIILSPGRSVKIRLERDADTATLSFDGAENSVLRNGQILEITRSEYITRMVRFNSSNFYGMLKNKLFHKE